MRAAMLPRRARLTVQQQYNSPTKSGGGAREQLCHTEEQLHHTRSAEVAGAQTNIAGGFSARNQNAITLSVLTVMTSEFRDKWRQVPKCVGYGTFALKCVPSDIPFIYPMFQWICLLISFRITLSESEVASCRVSLLF